MVWRMQGRPMEEDRIQRLIRGKHTGTLQVCEVRPKNSHDILDLRLYLGVARVSLGEIGVVLAVGQYYPGYQVEFLGRIS